MKKIMIGTISYTMLKQIGKLAMSVINRIANILVCSRDDHLIVSKGVALMFGRCDIGRRLNLSKW